MEPVAVASGDDALGKLDGCDLVISDLRMPGLDGMSLLAEARRRRPDLPSIMTTGHATVDLAVEAMRAGAANFITKPFELDDLEQAVRAALRVEARAPTRSAGNAGATRAGEVFIGESAAA